MPKRKKKKNSRRRRKIPLAIVGGAGVSLFVKPKTDWNSPAEALAQGNLMDFGKVCAFNYFGYNVYNGNWSIMNMKGWLPILIGAAVHKFVGGFPLNLNRYIPNGSPVNI